MTLKSTDEPRRFTLRLPQEIEEQIDQARGTRPGKVSRNTWIIEAIEEKLTRERVAKGRKARGN